MCGTECCALQISCDTHGRIAYSSRGFVYWLWSSVPFGHRTASAAVLKTMRLLTWMANWNICVQFLSPQSYVDWRRGLMSTWRFDFPPLSSVLSAIGSCTAGAWMLPLLCNCGKFWVLHVGKEGFAGATGEEAFWGRKNGVRWETASCFYTEKNHLAFQFISAILCFLLPKHNHHQWDLHGELGVKKLLRQEGCRHSCCLLKGWEAKAWA